MRSILDRRAHGPQLPPAAQRRGDADRSLRRAVAGLPCQVLDTRKTTPGWRLLEKYAVRCGGGHNHRMGLVDGILIKDNHLAGLAGERQAVVEAVRLARRSTATRFPSRSRSITWAQLDAALAARPDIVLLDNMTPEQMREAVRRRDARRPACGWKPPAASNCRDAARHRRDRRGPRQRRRADALRDGPGHRAGLPCRSRTEECNREKSG